MSVETINYKVIEELEIVMSGGGGVGVGVEDGEAGPTVEVSMIDCEWAVLQNSHYNIQGALGTRVITVVLTTTFACL